MNPINWKRFFAAVFLALILATFLDFMINAVLLRNAWQASAACWLPVVEMNRRVPLGWLAMLLVLAFQSFLFARVGWHGLRRGFEFGLWLGIAAFIGVALGISSFVAWPSRLIWAMASQQFMNCLVTGFSLGVVYRPTAAR